MRQLLDFQGRETVKYGHQSRRDSKLRMSVLARTSRPDDPIKTNTGSDIELNAFCISQSQLSVELTDFDL
jgi:hypothetical protein